LIYRPINMDYLILDLKTIKSLLLTLIL